MRIVWATDIHLNYVAKSAAIEFFQRIEHQHPDGIFLTGDIAEGVDICQWLELLMKHVSCPVYFVLGNHDYYGSSLKAVRQNIARLDAKNPTLNWLGDGKVIALNNEVALLGHGGWGDARAGDFLSTPIRINDHRQIEELSHLPRPVLMTKLNALGEESANILSSSIHRALQWAKRIVILTHVPPFVGACWYQGQAGGDVRWLPDFVCLANGSTLLRLASAQPQISFEVYCGHTHSSGTYSPLDNLCVHTGAAEYKRPQLQQLVEI